jgi:hypothetical protein
MAMLCVKTKEGIWTFMDLEKITDPENGQVIWSGDAKTPTEVYWKGLKDRGFVGPEITNPMLPE